MFDKKVDKKPKVSIIVPTYNRLKFLKSCLESIREQTLQEWECIIVDDGSYDGTITFLQDLCLNDNRFKYFIRPDYFPKGAPSCRNYGLIESCGKYIQWLDDDDLLSRTKLELQVKKLEEIKGDNFYTTCSWDLYWPNKSIELKNLISVNESLNQYNFFSRLVKEQTFIPASAYLIPRSITFSAGFWSQSLTLNDDAEYFTRVLLNAEKLVMTEGCYVLYREHSNDRISTKKDIPSLKSFILSLQLMQAHLRRENIEATDYFKWKLMKIFEQYSYNSMHVLRLHENFFRENGINIKYRTVLRWKINLYKKIVPVVKKIKQNNPF
jgi:glycosyltransferase involved in cell wall biosynthesis